MNRESKDVVLSEQERTELERMVRKATTPQSLATRARIILLAAAGKSAMEICRELHVTRATLGKWKRRFLEMSLNGLQDEPRSGHPVKYGTRIRMRIVNMAELAAETGMHWTIRKLAKHLSLNRGIVQRVLHGTRLEISREQEKSQSGI